MGLKHKKYKHVVLKEKPNNQQVTHKVDPADRVKIHQMIEKTRESIQNDPDKLKKACLLLEQWLKKSLK